MNLESGVEWKHEVTGRTFEIIEPNPEEVFGPEEDEYPHESESFVLVKTPDYETREWALLAERLFVSQLKRVE